MEIIGFLFFFHSLINGSLISEDLPVFLADFIKTFPVRGILAKTPFNFG
ncbi:hypothetical protein CWATWH0005_5832 [Crocosphaera watsonii WH 0005]|uniref:Uncharacterized protein n=1 Tax=Crocosphaera watsonii WH 0005 TaxID=423472 RepID=T2IVC8_CROWT|nr:hypothetical protein CWATWH0005_5832 [Crocosphaera watsonii WH 0005]